MALTIDAQSNSGNTTQASSFTWNHTCAASAVLYVGVELGRGIVPTSITFNGVALTEVLRVPSSGNDDASIWNIDTPASGTHAIVITMPSSTWGSGGATSFLGAASPSLGATASNDSTSSAVSSLSQAITTTVANSIIFDSLWQNNVFTTTATGTGHTKNAETTTNDGQLGATGTTTTTTAGSYTVGYSWGSNVTCALALVEVKPVTTAVNSKFFALM